MAMEFKEEYSVPLTIHPKKHNVLYSAVANGQPGQWRKRDSGAEAFLIQSTDSGQSWKKLDGAISQANRSFVESFAFDPANADCMTLLTVWRVPEIVKFRWDQIGGSAAGGKVAEEERIAG